MVYLEVAADSAFPHFVGVPHRRKATSLAKNGCSVLGGDCEQVLKLSRHRARPAASDASEATAAPDCPAKVIFDAEGIARGDGDADVVALPNLLPGLEARWWWLAFIGYRCIKYRQRRRHWLGAAFSSLTSVECLVPRTAPRWSHREECKPPQALSL